MINRYCRAHSLEDSTMQQLKAVALAVCALLCAGSALAQSAPRGAATLSGKVLDPDSKVVANAALIIRNEATNEIRTASTDAVGRFSLSGLPAGMYTIEVAVPGFEIVRRSGIRASEGIVEDVSINLTLANI